jgi:hypothetical protein
MRYKIRKHYLVVALFLNVVAAYGQSADLSISERIDTLMTRLIDDPNNSGLQTELIDLYVQSFNPELALLELSYAEALGHLGGVGTMVKAKVQASLEQIVPAIRSLQLAYLQSPNDEALLLLGVMEYSRGNSDMGSRILKRLGRHTPGLSVELLKQYEKFYLNGRKIVARGIGAALQDIDPVSYTTYFPRPEISILSPADNFSTEASQTSVIFEVKHSRPIQRVTLKDQILFARGEDKGESVSEPYLQSFSQLANLSEGRNVLDIKAVDIFGFESERTVVVNGMSFGRPSTWSSPLSDSLKKEFLTLRSYIPETDLLAPKNQAVRTLVIAATAGPDSLEYFDRGLAFHDFLTHPYSGLALPSNAKILLGSRVNAQNVSVVTEEWLIRGATFQSVTVLYVAGRWEILPDRWNVYDVSGQRIDFKPILERLGQLATAGVAIICDGSVNDRSTLEAGLRTIVQSSTIMMNVAVMPGPRAWIAGMTSEITQVGTAPVGAEAALISPYNIARQGAVSVISREEAGLVIAQNPAAKIAYQYQQMVVQLEGKLAADKAPAAARQKIQTFTRDWRRFGEVRRYLQNELSLADFVVRAEEYLSRSEAGRESH